MQVTLLPGARRGSVSAPASKSQLHRLLLCAALGERSVTLTGAGRSGDIDATVACLRALGAAFDAQGETLRVSPFRQPPRGVCELYCGESASTLRFLLPVAGALGAEAVFHRALRLPLRPIAPLDALLRSHGMTIYENGEALICKGKLLAGDYAIRGDVSSQFITGLLFALPLLDGDSTLRVTGPLESAPYIMLTEKTLRLAGILFTKTGNRYTIPGRQRFALPETAAVEGDWSGAAALLCMGALSPGGVRVRGLRLNSVQGDRAVLDILTRFGARAEASEDSVTVRRDTLRGIVIDAAQVPDLVPALCAVAAAAEGETRVEHALRLRLKESDRLHTTAVMLRALGAEVTEREDGLVICGKPSLTGGAVNAAHDHRVAMAAAVAASACRESVTIDGAECVDKSYPAFWEDVQWLSM